VPGSVVGAQPAVMARQSEQQPAPVVAGAESSTPAQVQVQVDAQPQAEGSPGPELSEAEREAMRLASQASKDQAAIAIVEETLHKNMKPLIDQFGGILGKFGVNTGDFLPILET